MTDWMIFHGDQREPHDGIDHIGAPPPWRDFTKHDEHRAKSYRAQPHEIRAANAALHLRRPLLVTGFPGTGKSSLAYAVAHELKLGPVLEWPINSRSTLSQGIYEYDAIGRLRDANLARERNEQTKSIGAYLTLGPLGTALYPAKRPRVLLIDEIDKSDLDFPNDLLHVLEQGEFTIPELVRIPKNEIVDVAAWGTSRNAETIRPQEKKQQDEPINQNHAESNTNDILPAQVPIAGGYVRCDHFPFIVITSNGERDLPAAFLRRCIRIDKPQPGKNELLAIIEAHLKHLPPDANAIVDKFADGEAGQRRIAVDQFLNAVFLLSRDRAPADAERDALLAVLLKALDET